LLWYDHDCPNCGVTEDVPRPLEEYDVCPVCDSKVRILVAAVPTHGIVFSNVEHSNQLGVTFHSNSEKRKFFRDNPDIVPFSKGSTQDQNLKWKIEQKRESTAKKLGYSDAEDHHAHMKKQKTKKRKHATAPPSNTARNFTVPPQRVDKKSTSL
jgi:hypothetical protein